MKKICTYFELNQIIIDTVSGQIELSNVLIKHNLLDNLDWAHSGHIGFAGIEFGTTSYWNTRPLYVPPQGMLVVYSDYSKTSSGVDVPNFKIGDGNAYLVDKPFVGEDVRGILEAHVNDLSIHITEQERQKWNNKLNYVEPDSDLLELTRN